MALFNKEDKADKQAQKAQELMSKYGLENLTSPQTINAVKDIAWTLTANKFADIGAALQGNSADVAKQTYLRALVEQNFIIIRQLDELTRK